METDCLSAGEIKGNLMLFAIVELENHVQKSNIYVI